MTFQCITSELKLHNLSRLTTKTLFYGSFRILATADLTSCSRKKVCWSQLLTSGGRQITMRKGLAMG